MKNLIKIKLKKINKTLKCGGLQLAIKYDPSERKDTFLLVNWIGHELLKEFVEEKISVFIDTTIENAMTFIDSKFNDR